MAKIIGLMRIGRDAEVRYLANGSAVVNFPVVYNYGKKDETGKTPSQWVECAWFGEFAEKMAQYMVKGSSHCFTLDQPHIETYKKNDGGEGFKLVGRVIDVELGPRVDQQEHHEPAARQQRQPAPTPREQARDRQSAAANKRPVPDFDDAVPF